MLRFLLIGFLLISLLKAHAPIPLSLPQYAHGSAPILKNKWNGNIIARTKEEFEKFTNIYDHTKGDHPSPYSIYDFFDERWIRLEAEFDPKTREEIVFKVEKEFITPETQKEGTTDYYFIVTPILAGKLEKKGDHFNAAWKERLFVLLVDGQLIYYQVNAESGSYVMKGVIDVNAMIALRDKSDSDPPGFEMDVRVKSSMPGRQTTKRTYRLRTTSSTSSLSEFMLRYKIVKVWVDNIGEVSVVFL